MFGYNKLKKRIEAIELRERCEGGMHVWEIKERFDIENGFFSFTGKFGIDCKHCLTKLPADRYDLPKKK